MENCGGCNSTAAPGFAEQVIAGANPGGRPKGLPHPKSEGVLETRRRGSEDELTKGREKPPWGVPLPRAGQCPAPTKEGTASVSAVGAAHLGRPPCPTAQLEPRRNKGAFKEGSVQPSISIKPAAAKDGGHAFD